METHIGRGVGTLVEKEVFQAKDYIKICSGNISYSLCEKLFTLLDRGVKIKVLTSDVITGDQNSKQANQLAKEKIKHLKKGSKDSIESTFQYKVISTDDVPLIHAKIFVIDGKCAIMGSANFTENSFHNYAEYILITKEIDMVNTIERDFESLWLDCNSFKNQITTVNVRKILKNLKKKIS
jgi:phosphatidylserine/phosphatidylglycerophosphate/cardiolipin synthase-like enzyme